MSGAKILITGMANTGKTTLVKSLKDVLVVARDGKPFSLELPHVNVPDFDKIEDLLNLVEQKFDTYNDKFGNYPKTVVFDSVSRIFTDIEANCNRRFSGYDVWTSVNREMNTLLSDINSLLDSDMNIILIAHVVWDENAKKFIETCKGAFAKVGGFLSTVDYAINIDIVGKKRIITHKGINLSRTLLDGIPEKEEVDKFNLQDYLDKVNAKSVESEKWSI